MRSRRTWCWPPARRDQESELTLFDSARQGDSSRSIFGMTTSGQCRPNLSEDDLLLTSAQGQSNRFRASDESLRPMGRATSVSSGMRFDEQDELLSMEVVSEGMELLVATAFGYAKRTPVQSIRPTTGAARSPDFRI